MYVRNEKWTHFFDILVEGHHASEGLLSGLDSGLEVAMEISEGPGSLSQLGRGKVATSKHLIRVSEQGGNFIRCTLYECVRDILSISRGFVGIRHYLTQ